MEPAVVVTGEVHRSRPRLVHGVVVGAGVLVAATRVHGALGVLDYGTDVPGDVAALDRRAVHVSGGVTYPVGSGPVASSGAVGQLGDQLGDAFGESVEVLACGAGVESL